MYLAPWKSAIPALLMALCALTLPSAVRAGDCVKTVRWYDDVPYAFKGADGEVQGFVMDLMREALVRMGCTPRFVEMPWARALVELEAGRLDILPGALKTPERERFAYFSRSINRSPNVLFVSKAAAEKYRIKNLTDMVGTDFRLGAQIGVSYGPEYVALQSNPAFVERLVPITQRRSAWKMVEAGRLDGMIADEVTGLVELQQLGISQGVVKTKVIVSSESAMVALSRQSVSRGFVDALDRSLNGMLADGRYKQLWEHYMPCPAAAEGPGCR
jgi:polar amino acid transport system substrate-binding protein